MAEIPVSFTELLAKIGAKLKSARQAQGLSLPEIAARTRINQIFLAKIENGEIEGLPDLAFVRGFIRNYVQVLALTEGQLDDEIAQFGDAMGHAISKQQALPEERLFGHESRGISVTVLGLGAGLLLLVAWIVFLLFSSPVESPPLSGDAPPAQDAPAPGAQGPAVNAPPPAGAVQEEGNRAGAVSSPASGAAVSAAPPEARQNLKLTIRGLEKTWVRLSIDKEPPMDVFLEPAETLAWEAEQEIRLTVGNSQGVAVYLNGEDIILSRERNRLIPGVTLNKLTLLRLEN